MLKRILGLLGWLGVALVLAAVAIRFLKPGEIVWQQWASGLALAGLACTLLYMLSQWREIARSFSGREARFGSLATASVVVVLAIIVAINYLALRHNKRWDLTAAKQFSLSDQTRSVLRNLDQPVRIKVFAESNDFPRFRDRLDEYEYASDQVSVEYIDAIKDPRAANKYNVQSLGTIVLEYGDRTERVVSDGEQEITNGLIKVIQGRQSKVFFVQGHGEKNTEGSDRTSYSAIATALGSDNYVVDKLVLAQQKEVPADATVLVVAGPKTDFLPPEIEMLKAYLARGGKILFMLDPPDRVDSPPLTGLTALLKEWAIDVGNNMVVDVSGIGQLFGTNESVPVAAKYNPHTITANFNLMTAYPLARSVSPVTGDTSGKFAQALVETSANSWAESDLKTLMASGKVERNLEQGDKAGPVSLAAAVSSPATAPPPAPPPADPAKAADGSTPDAPEDAPKAETRIVVFGDSDFAANGYLGIPGNRDLFLNTVNWLAQQENLIAIRPKDPQDRRVTLTARTENLIFWLSVLIIPGVILLAGVQTWWRRR